ncbi:MAG: glutathione peroxidase [Polyangiaceae bacterium]
MTSVHDFEVKTIDGAAKKLSDYKGRVLLLVNVASRCGYTSQYAELEQLHREYGPKGLSVLGFPANDFGAQEPGDDAAIKTFCSTTFDVTFDMFSKIVATGPNISPLFDHLTAVGSPYGGPVKWNFNKFLVSKEGSVVGRFEPGVAPKDPALLTAIQNELGKGGTSS